MRYCILKVWENPLLSDARGKRGERNVREERCCCLVSGERRDATALHRAAAFCCTVQVLPDSNQMLLEKPKPGSTLLGEWLCKFKPVTSWQEPNLKPKHSSRRSPELLLAYAINIMECGRHGGWRHGAAAASDIFGDENRWGRAHSLPTSSLIYSGFDQLEGFLVGFHLREQALSVNLFFICFTAAIFLSI